MTLEQLQKLPPAFIPNTGKVTAGNASGINDGSAGMVIMSAEKAAALSIKPLATIKAVGKGGCHPSVMGMSPVPAVQDLMTRSGLKIKDFELVEVNEAFAAQSIGVMKKLGLRHDLTNVNGGAIAIGHPIGASGARVLVSLLHEMARRDAKKGLATLCIGGGQGGAVLLEREAV